MIVVTKYAAFNLDHHPIFVYGNPPHQRMVYEISGSEPTSLGIVSSEKIASAFSRIADCVGRGERVCKLFDLCD